MGKREQTARDELLRDQRGVVYVEQMLMVTLGLVLAGLLGAAGALMFASRYEGMTKVIHASAP